MTVDQVIAYYKTGAAAARALGLTRAIVSLWKSRGIPLSRQMHLEAVTEGALKAGRAPKRKRNGKHG